MRSFAEGIVYVAAGVLAGALGAYLAIESSGEEAAGNSDTWVSRAAGLAGPSAYYVRAHFMMQGRLPPAPGQIDEATTGTDSSGTALTGNCRYVLTSKGAMPRWWSLVLLGTAAASRQAIADADNTVREADGSIVIRAAATPQPGNWLRTDARGGYTLLYSAAAGEQRLAATPPFTITLEDCQ
jgi:hypothetical protein